MGVGSSVLESAAPWIAADRRHHLRYAAEEVYRRCAAVLKSQPWAFMGCAARKFESH